MRKSIPLLVGALALCFPISASLTLPADAATCSIRQTNCNSGGGHDASDDIMMISCRVLGLPEARPDDLTFKNIGEITIPAGTEIAWQVKQLNERGRYFLPRDLWVGAEIDYADVLKTGMPAKTPCLSSIIH